MLVDADDKLNKKIVEFLVAQVKPKIDIVACSCYGFDDEGQKIAHFLIVVDYLVKIKMICIYNFLMIVMDKLRMSLLRLVCLGEKFIEKILLNQKD